MNIIENVKCYYRVVGVRGWRDRMQVFLEFNTAASNKKRKKESHKSLKQLQTFRNTRFFNIFIKYSVCLSQSKLNIIIKEHFWNSFANYFHSVYIRFHFIQSIYKQLQNWRTYLYFFVSGNRWRILKAPPANSRT